MLCTTKALRRYTLQATDGPIGRISDAYFDDQTWAVRYLVVDADTWLERERFLISPTNVVEVDRERSVARLDLSLSEVEPCRPAECEQPIEEHGDLDDHPRFWPPHSHERDQNLDAQDHHLRSAVALEDYVIAAIDGEFGHVESVIIDDTDWAVRYLEIDTRAMWPGKNVLVSPEWIVELDWERGKVRVDLPKEAIKQSPELKGEEVTRAYEVELCRYYNREGYWERECPTA